MVYFFILKMSFFATFLQADTKEITDSLSDQARSVGLVCEAEGLVGIADKGPPKGVDFSSIKYQSKKEKGSVHIFSGIGNDIATLRFEGEKVGAEDKLIRAVENVYISGDDQRTLIWRFFPEDQIAIKTLYFKQGRVGTFTSWYKCR